MSLGEVCHKIKFPYKTVDTVRKNKTKQRNKVFSGALFVSYIIRNQKSQISGIENWYPETNL